MKSEYVMQQQAIAREERALEREERVRKEELKAEERTRKEEREERVGKEEREAEEREKERAYQLELANLKVGSSVIPSNIDGVPAFLSTRTVMTWLRT